MPRKAPTIFHQVERPPHIHHFILPASDKIHSMSNIIIGQCACGVSKRHQAFWASLGYGDFVRARHMEQAASAANYFGKEYLPKGFHIVD